jgi:hypothetical protein
MKDTTEEEIRAYYDGLREGVMRYAHWNNGQQFVGTCGKTLKEAIAQLNDEERKALLT